MAFFFFFKALVIQLIKFLNSFMSPQYILYLDLDLMKK